MEIKCLENYNFSYLRFWIVIMNYLFGVFGGYKKIGLLLTSQIEGNPVKEVSPFIQFCLYCLIICITVWGIFPLIKDGIHQCNKACFKDIIPIATVANIAIGLVFIMFSLLGLEISLNMMNKYEESNFLLTIFMAIIYAPIVEELVFRGAMLHVLKFENKYIAIIFTSIMFSIIHVKDYGFNSASVLYFFIYVILGFSFGISYIYTKSIFGAIINHLYWNSLTILIMIIKVISGTNFKY